MKIPFAIAASLGSIVQSQASAQSGNPCGFMFKYLATKEIESAKEISRLE